MKKQFRKAANALLTLGLVLGLISCLTYWQREGYAAGQTLNSLNRLDENLNRLDENKSASVMIRPSPRLAAETPGAPSNNFTGAGLASPNALSATACIARPSGLVHWWRAEGDANDAVGTQHGTLNGSTVISAAAEGQVGQAFKFDGANGYVALPDNLFSYPTTGTGTTPFSFELWFKTTTRGVILGQQTTVPYDAPVGYVPAIYVGIDGRLRVEMFFNNTALPMTSVSLVNNGVYHHVAVTYDGATQSVYLDGNLMASRSHTQVAFSTNYKYQLGTGRTTGWPGGISTSGGWLNFSGLIDEPSLYDRALTDLEVAAIFDAGHFGKCLSNCTLSSASISAQGGAICTGGSANVTVTITGGVFPYTVTLTNGGGTLTGPSPISFPVSPASTTTYAVLEATDASGCPVTATGNATITVIPPPQTPTITPSGSTTICEGGSVILNSSSAIGNQWYRNGSPIDGATSQSYLATAAGSYTVVVSVSGCAATATSTETVVTVNPATAIITPLVNQGLTIGQNVTFSVTADGANLTYRWRKNGSLIDGATGNSYTITAATAGDAGNYEVEVSGACGSATSSATLGSCTPPVVAITGPTSGALYPIDTPVHFTGTFNDSSGGPHTATWRIDDLTLPGLVDETAGTVGLNHTFSEPGVYHVKLTVNNSCGQEGSASVVGGLTAMVVVYDPSAGFVTGGGWLTSPAGAFAANTSLTGKATFGFVSKYVKGASVPTGETEFQFALANLNFKSTSYEWLVVSGSKAQYKGTGTINGTGVYRFILTAIDGNTSNDGKGNNKGDKLRIRIWNNSGGSPIYDNQLNAPDSNDPTTVIDGGSIVIHTGGTGKTATAQATRPESSRGEAGDIGQHGAVDDEWQIVLGRDGERQTAIWGGSAAPYFDLIVPGDYDGDGIPDLGIFRRATGQWLLLFSNTVITRSGEAPPANKR